MGCREFFASNSANPERCKELQKESLESQLDWESETAAECSPGPVDDDESLVRYWLNPVHYDSQTGQLKPTAFDDASNKGLSVNRLQHANMDALLKVANDRVQQWNSNASDKPQRELIGFSDFQAREVRQVHTAEPFIRRAFGVYDTAKVDDISHADVCQIASNAQGGRSARYHMREALNARLKKPL